MPALTRRAALGTLATVTLAGRARAQSRPLRIGILNDQSGPYADVGGQGTVIAARLAAAEFGDAILGRPVEFLSADHQNKPDIATAIAGRLIDTDGVDVILDGAASNTSLAIQQVTREKQRLFLMTGPASSDLTGKSCSAFGIQWTYDTYALANGTAQALVKNGGDSWFFLTADYAFGYALERDTTEFVKRAGGKVLGSVRHPLGTSDFSSYLVQAKASGAKVIGLANAGTDSQNAIKQAAEFGIVRGGQRLASLLIFVTDVIALGLPTAQGLVMTTSFYWDHDDATRAWAKRFMAQKPKPPTMIHAASYAAVRHYLGAAKSVGGTDAAAVAAKMKAMPVNDMYNHDVRIRPDGRVLHTMYLMEVKSPAESKGEFDVLKQLAVTPGEQAFRPMAEGGCPFVKS